jgi:hypothetical protein
MEILAKFLDPIMIGLLALTILVFARVMARRRGYQVEDLRRLGILPDDLRLLTGEDRGPLGALKDARRGLRLADKPSAPTEDRVMALAFYFFHYAAEQLRPAEALAALRIAENLLVARADKPLAA